MTMMLLPTVWDLDTLASTYVASVFLCIYLATLYRRKLEDPMIMRGKDPQLTHVIGRCSRLARGPRPPIWCSNGHLQFIPWLFQNELHRLVYRIVYERVYLIVTDRKNKVSTPAGEKGGYAESLKESITLDIFPALRDIEKLSLNAPIVLFAPGLRCHSHDMPGNTVVRAAFAAGFRSIVMNRRGHTPNQKLLSPRWSLFGDVDDLEQVYWHIRDSLAPTAPLHLHGLSSGCGLVVNCLGAWDERRANGDLRAPWFVSAVAVSPGYDITTCLARFDWPYEPLLLANVKNHFVAQNAAVLRRGHDGDDDDGHHDTAAGNKAVDAALAATSLQTFLEACAPFTGYGDAAKFYAHCNPINKVHLITTPLLILNAKDDPCCKYTNAFEVSPHTTHGGLTYAGLVAASPRGALVFTPSGSHCPFLDGALAPLCRDPLPKADGGAGFMLRSWADDVAVECFQACSEVFGEREMPEREET